MSGGRRKSKDPRKVRKRYFRCPVCGEVSPVTKAHGRTQPGHIKTMYCCWCMEVRDFIQIE